MGQWLQRGCDAFVRLAGGIFVGIDRSSGKDFYCEARREKDGSITILDSYEVPSEPTESSLHP